ncbi:MAG: pentapeptide repeat-containing protein [Cyanobacteriota bacterium]|nr:pentapeptide repeat-containing protein [Cyanobacteriota bacterium]
MTPPFPFRRASPSPEPSLEPTASAEPFPEPSTDLLDPFPDAFPPERSGLAERPATREPLAGADPNRVPAFRASNAWSRFNRSASLQLLIALLVALGLTVSGSRPLILAAGLVLLVLSLAQLLPPLWRHLCGRLEDLPTARILAAAALLLAAVTIPLALGWLDPLAQAFRNGNWEAIGAIGEGVVGAFGSILVACVALMIAWRQVMVDQRLTTQQNRITQAQTIDNFIQGISELISDEEGMLEDWPLERMLAEGRLAAVFGSIDREGKARVLRFLSHARLLTPLKRDQRLGRAILDGEGNYEEDRVAGVPVIRLQQLLQGVDLSGCDLRGVEFNGADLRGADLSFSDLTGANVAGANLAGANLERARLEGCRFFYGRPQTASPRQPAQPRDLTTGAGSGAVVENCNLAGVRFLDPHTLHYLASWSGPRSRATLPGGPQGIPSQLAGSRPSMGS